MDDRTIDIIKRFRESWEETAAEIDDLITQHGFKHFVPLQEFISILKKNGEDQFFRIGRSMDGLIFSRSVVYGLRKDQKFISIKVNDSSFEITLRDGEKVYREYIIKDLEDIRLTKLLSTLKDTLVD